MNDLTIIFGNKSLRIDNRLYVREEDFEIPHGDDYKLAIDFLNKVQESFFKNLDLSNNLSYREISLWWFIYQTLIGRLKKLINFISKFELLLNEYKPKKVEIEKNFQFSNIIKNLCDKHQIPLHFSKVKNIQNKLKSKTKHSINKSRYKKIHNSKINKRLQIFSKTKNTIPSFSNKHVFVIPTVYRRIIFDSKNNVFKKGEYIQQELIDLVNNNSVIGIDVDYTFYGESNILEERLQDSIPWIPLEKLLERNSNNKQKQFLKNYLELIQSKNFHSLFEFNKFNIWSEIQDIFYEMTFEPYLPFYLQIIDSIYDIFSKEKPSSIFLPYETGPLALSIIAVCKKLKIQTIGIQHGYIYEHHPSYSYGPFLKNNSLNDFPIPDQTLLFGNYVKNLLVKNGYPESKLTVIGNPAFYNLDKISQSINVNHLKNNLSIVDKQKVILFTTGKLQRNYSASGKYNYDELIWEYLLENFSNNPDYFIILKPHPSEKDISIYTEILNKFSSKNAIISQNGIFELILLSDVVVSVFSSTIFDSIFFAKPTIRVKFEHETHPIFDNVEGIFTSDLEQLSSSISELLTNSTLIDSVKENSKKLLKEHYGLPITDQKNILEKILKKI